MLINKLEIPSFDIICTKCGKKQIKVILQFGWNRTLNKERIDLILKCQNDKQIEIIQVAKEEIEFIEKGG